MLIAAQPRVPKETWTSGSREKLFVPVHALGRSLLLLRCRVVPQVLPSMRGNFEGSLAWGAPQRGAALVTWL